MIIKNYEELAVSPVRGDALKIIEEGFIEVDPMTLVCDTVKFNPEFKSLIVHNKTYDIIRGRIFVVGGGKAAGRMAMAMENLLGPDNIVDGLISYHENGYEPKKIQIINAGHPFPDKNGIKATKKMMKFKKIYKINEKDVVICLISGGASSMLTLPPKGVSLKDKRKTTLLLLESGADIREINTVRKHISEVKGGKLASCFSPAKVISLVISDVIGNKLDVIGSGPTVPDTSTFMDAYSVLANHGILEKVPKAVKNHIMEGCGGKKEENPKKLENTDNYIIGGNASALDAMALAAKNLGYNPLIMTLGLTGEPEIAAKQFIEDAYSKKYARKTAIICGGETYPKLPDKRGKGGRNLHLAASILKHLKGKNFTFISINSDGSDFESEAAGAVIDSQDSARAAALNLDIEEYLKKYDTYNFFNKLDGSIIKTGRTGTNVADLMLLLKK